MISIVIPVYNERDSLLPLHAEIVAVASQARLELELVFVDDGSTDRSRAILASKALIDPAVRVVGLSRNFGHEMATTAGLQHARGQAAHFDLPHSRISRTASSGTREEAMIMLLRRVGY